MKLPVLLQFEDEGEEGNQPVVVPGQTQGSGSPAPVPPPTVPPDEGEEE